MGSKLSRALIEGKFTKRSRRSKLGGDEIVEYAKGVLTLWMKV
jgi:hypothetical protein